MTQVGAASHIVISKFGCFSWACVPLVLPIHIRITAANQCGVRTESKMFRVMTSPISQFYLMYDESGFAIHQLQLPYMSSFFSGC